MPSDSLTVKSEIRYFDQAAIEGYRSQSEFDYTISPHVENNLIQYLWLRLVEYLDRLFTFNSSIALDQIIFYLVILGALAYLIIVIFKVDATLPFFKKSTEPDYGHDDIKGESNYQLLVKEAASKKQFKAAIHYTYLLTLKNLQEAGLLEINPWKTSTEYYYELDDRFKKPFHELSSLFAYSWFGDFQVEKGHFNKMKEMSDTLMQKLPVRR